MNECFGKTWDGPGKCGLSAFRVTLVGIPLDDFEAFACDSHLGFLVAGALNNKFKADAVVSRLRAEEQPETGIDAVHWNRMRAAGAFDPPCRFCQSAEHGTADHPGVEDL